MNKSVVIPSEVILDKIYEIRGVKVMLDRDLAELYEVQTKVLKQSVKRNLDIFPEHFMFELTKEENEFLRSQFVTSKKGRGGTRYLPLVFTEHGILQLASILRSKRARYMSIRIIEIFVKMREMLLSHQELMVQLEEVSRKVAGHDEKINLIFGYLKEVEQARQEELEQQNRKRIGFKTNNEE